MGSRVRIVPHARSLVARRVKLGIMWTRIGPTKLTEQLVDQRRHAAVIESEMTKMSLFIAKFRSSSQRQATAVLFSFSPHVTL